MRVGTDYEESEAQSFTVLVAVLVNPTPTATLKLPPPIRTSPPAMPKMPVRKAVMTVTAPMNEASPMDIARAPRDFAPRGNAPEVAHPAAEAAQGSPRKR